MLRYLLAALCFFLALPAAQAADTLLKFDVKEAMSTADAEAKLDDDIKFFFGEQKHGAAAKEFGEDKTSQRTNGFNKTAKEACQHAFLSAMLSLQSRARSLGADAVVNIRSNWKDKEFSSTSEFECADGSFMTGVALKAEFVKLK